MGICQKLRLPYGSFGCERFSRCKMYEVQIRRERDIELLNSGETITTVWFKGAIAIEIYCRKFNMVQRGSQRQRNDL
jgi:hypothetical protein